MKKFFSMVAVVLCMIFSSDIKAADFVEGMEDLPIMDKLKQIEPDNITFGNHQTRFVEAYFEGTGTSFDKVETFYKETLPQLGWNFEGTDEHVLHFQRDVDILDIACEKAKPLLVRITLKSKD